MDIPQLQNIVQTLSDDFAKSWKAAGLDPITVDQQVSEMTRQSDTAELIKSAQIMQKELGFGEVFDAQSDGLQSDFEDDIMKANEAFRSDADPIRKKLGKATESHPQEVEAIKKHCEELGVVIVERNGTMAYSPGLSAGKQGTLIIDPDASISAWRHEYQHVIDDYNAGWSGFRIFEDQDATWEREKRAYELELQLAEELRDQDVYNIVKALMEERKIEIYEK